MRSALFAVPFLLLQPAYLGAEEASEVNIIQGTLGAATSEIFMYLKENGYVFYTNQTDLNIAIETGQLVQLDALDDYDVITKHGPQYVLPIVATFAQRLARQYRNAKCGKLMIVRGHDMSVPILKTNRLSLHASGAMLDIAVPQAATHNCRDWLELTLLSIETAGRIDISLSSYPGHISYHISVFVEEYEQWLKENT